MSTPRTTDATSPPHHSRTLPTQSRQQSRQPTLKLVNPSTPRHILLPVSRLPNTSATVCSTSIKHALDAYNSAADSRSPRSKHSMGKLTRATRSPTVSLTNLDAFTTIPTSSTASLSTSQLKGTVSPNGSIKGDPFTSDVPSQPAWLKDHLGNFVVMYDSLELTGFQLYAVEKWLVQLLVVQRTKLLTTIVVFTGDNKDKIYVTILRPHPSLDQEAAEIEFNTAIQKLRQDGARPKETDKGIIMTTFLPNFRPDLTIVPIPGGNFRLVQERFYANIDLLRMGCTGRSALTLDEPYESTKEKFIQIYHFPEHIAQHPTLSTSAIRRVSPQNTHTPSNSVTGTGAFLSPSSARGSRLEDGPSFQTTVLNFVKIVQSALALFGLFEIAEEERDGLLCDVTVDGIRRCVEEIGKLVDVEPTERILDPAALAAILSTVVSVKNKLHALGITHSKDPFLEPVSFIEALVTFQTTHHKRHHSISSSGAPSSHSHHRQAITPFLSTDLIRRISAVYVSKVRSPEPYKVHRVLKHKIDDSIALASNLSESLSGSLRGPSSHHHKEGAGAAFEGGEHVPAMNSVETPVLDLEFFARMVVGSNSGGGAIDSLRYVWTGKKNAGVREKERKEKGKELIEGQKERAKERERGAMKDGKVKSDGEDTPVGFTPGLLWKGTASKLFGGSFVDLGVGRPRRNTDALSDPEQPGGGSALKRGHPPSLMITQPSGLDIPSALPSPTRDATSQPPSVMSSPMLVPTSAPPSANPAFDASRRPYGMDARPVSFGAFNKDWDRRAYSRDDPDKADLDDDDLYMDDDVSSVYYGEPTMWSSVREVDWWVRGPMKKKRVGDTARRHSISVSSEYSDHNVLPVERMQADVDLCGAYADLVVKQEDMERITRLLQTLLDSTRRTNGTLSNKLFELEMDYNAIDERAHQLNITTRQTRTQIEGLAEGGRSLDYRMNELQRGTKRLDETLLGYQARTKNAMVLAEAEGANPLLMVNEGEHIAVPTDGDSAGLLLQGVDLRQRHPGRIIGNE